MSRELAVKTKNAILRRLPDADIRLKNIVINGAKRGCNGFITNPVTSKIAFVDTNVIPLSGNTYLYREAPVVNNYSNHGINHWCKTFDDFIDNVCKLVS